MSDGDRDSAAAYEELRIEHERVRAENDALRAENDALRAENDALRAEHDALRSEHEVLKSKLAELERRLGQNSGNSGKPPSRDSAGERQRQAEERKKRAGDSGAERRRGKQRGAKGSGLQMSAEPDVVVDHRPQRCEACGEALDETTDRGFSRRQVIDLPQVVPEVTEHRAHTYGCQCGHETTAAFPGAVRAPVSYGPRVRAIVAYFLGRQHIPNRRVAEAMADLFGLDISSGAVDSIYAEARRRLGVFMPALVVLLRSLPVLHADETTDRVGTATCWMHVVSTGLYTLIHASMTRGTEAIKEAGVLIGYRGVVVHDRLALYWKLKRAKHGLCGAHLLRDLAEVALVATQSAWAVGLATLLVEINTACESARQRGLKQLAPALQRGFAARYDALVNEGVAANPEPAFRKRDYLERRSFNLVSAFATHRRSILRFMYDLTVGFTNNQGERDLRPTKLHRKISGCFRSEAGAERFAHLRSYLSTTRKNGISAIDALVRLYEGDPWMPPQPS
ncbi:MAG: IS66 family transposase [Solirubrobacteraceae bacterium]